MSVSKLHFDYSGKFTKLSEGRKKYIELGLQCTFQCRKPNFRHMKRQHGTNFPYCGPLCESDYRSSFCPGDIKCKLHQGCNGDCHFIKCDYLGCNPCLSHMEVCGFCYDIEKLECYFHDSCECGSMKLRKKDVCSFCEYRNSSQFPKGMFGKLPEEMVLCIADKLLNSNIKDNASADNKSNKPIMCKNPYWYLKNDDDLIPRSNYSDYYKKLEEIDDFLDYTQFISSEYLDLDDVTEAYGTFEDEFYFSKKGGRKFKRTLHAY